MVFANEDVYRRIHELIRFRFPHKRVSGSLLRQFIIDSNWNLLFIRANRENAMNDPRTNTIYDFEGDDNDCEEYEA